MSAFLTDWAILIVRLTHLITGIAWIGASFYFVWLDNNLEKPKDDELKSKGVDGELWAVHGGGFYNPQKYLVAPKYLPQNLHWFYWESYSTWMSGIALFLLVYLANAKTMLIDDQHTLLSAPAASGFAIFILVGSWVIYDFICRTFRHSNATVGALTTGLIVFIAWMTGQFFAPRAAFLLTGAAMASAMTANVFFWIIPGQRKVITSMRNNEMPDPIHGQTGKQRSVHNTYFTVPVLIAMISNHFPMVYMAKDAWIALVFMMVSGAVFRHYFVAKHKNQHKISHILVATAFATVAIFLTMPKPAQTASATSVKPEFSEVQTIINNRCTQCHAEQPLMASTAPKGITLESADSINQYAAQIYTQVVQLKTMPLGNATEMEDRERMIIKNWFEMR
jgi:uncharacterized membrane protein